MTDHSSRRAARRSTKPARPRRLEQQAEPSDARAIDLVLERTVSGGSPLQGRGERALPELPLEPTSPAAVEQRNLDAGLDPVDARV